MNQASTQDAKSLFRDHAAYAAQLLHRLGVRRADVEDAVQEVFMVVHQKGGYVAGPAKPSTWIGAICTRIAANWRRRYRRQPPTDALRRTGSLPESTIVDCARFALDQLDGKYRDVFVLFEFQGHDCESIAAMLSLPVRTVYTRLRRARMRFVDALEAHTIMAHSSVTPPLLSRSPSR